MPDAHDASAEAIHKAKAAQQAVEVAREVQQQEMVDKTAAKVLDGIRGIFSNDNDKSPDEMHVLIQRVPLICKDIKNIDEKLDNIVTKEEFWPVKTLVYGLTAIILTGVIGALLMLVLYPQKQQASPLEIQAAVASGIQQALDTYKKP